MTITHQFLQDGGSAYEFREFKEIIEAYWLAISGLRSASHLVQVYRPDLSETGAALASWEAYSKKPHPYRGRIEGIPAEGFA